MKDKILVIEDEPSIADTITYALKTEGFDVISCATGETGRSKLEEGGVALVVLDVGLPDVSGFEWCREIRKTHPTPILFLTARSGEVDRVVGLEIGADDYMIKPFSPRELTARVRAILRRSQVKPPILSSKKEAGAFTVDEERCLIAFHGEALSLSRYEYRLLKAFVERPGRVLSRDQLMDLAWDAPESSMDRTVDAHIKSLRAKLKKIRPKEDPIRTHRGMGYSLKEQD
jgi:two-component system, OmpR family, catabolic regulation response regulator CreB